MGRIDNIRVWYNIETEYYRFQPKTVEEHIYAYTFTSIQRLVEFEQQHMPTVKIFEDIAQRADAITDGLMGIVRPRGKLVE